MEEEKKEEEKEESEEQGPSPKEVKEEEEKKEEEEDIDYSKELKKLNEQKPVKSELDKALRSLHFNAERVKELGGDPSSVIAPKEVKPDSGEFVTKEDMAEQYARTLASNDDELKVVMWQYKHGIQRTGNIHEDVDNAHLLANRGKIKRSFEEIKRIEKPGEGGGAGQKISKPEVPELDKTDQLMLTKRGFKFNPQTKEWEAKHNVVRYDPAVKAWISVKKLKT